MSLLGSTLGAPSRRVQPCCQRVASALKLFFSTFVWSTSMADHETATSIPGLIRSLLDDTRALIREELALARAEIREELSTAQAVAVAFAGAALAAAIGAVLLAVAIGGAIAY